MAMKHHCYRAVITILLEVHIVHTVVTLQLLVPQVSNCIWHHAYQIKIMMFG